VPDVDHDRRRRHDARRPVNALVALPEGAGRDPTALATAIRQLQRRLDANGTRRAMALHERHMKPTERRRLKSLRARRRAQRSKVRQLRRDVRAEARGR
jgi:ribosomal protein S21